MRSKSPRVRHYTPLHPAPARPSYCITEIMERGDNDPRGRLLSFTSLLPWQRNALGVLTGDRERGREGRREEDRMGRGGREGRRNKEKRERERERDISNSCRPYLIFISEQANGCDRSAYDTTVRPLTRAPLRGGGQILPPDGLSR